MQTNRTPVPPESKGSTTARKGFTAMGCMGSIATNSPTSPIPRDAAGQALPTMVPPSSPFIPRVPPVVPPSTPVSAEEAACDAAVNDFLEGTRKFQAALQTCGGFSTLLSEIYVLTGIRKHSGYFSTRRQTNHAGGVSGQMRGAEGLWQVLLAVETVHPLTRFCWQLKRFIL